MRGSAQKGFHKFAGGGSITHAASDASAVQS
jgi:hypothetical protein